MKNKQVTAILLSAVLALSSFMPMSSMDAFAAENPAAESTEAAAETEFEAESPDETESQEGTDTDMEDPEGQESGDRSDMEVPDEDPSEDPEEDLTEDPEERSDEESDVTEAATDDEAASEDKTEEETEEVPEAEDASNATTDDETASEAVVEETPEQAEKKEAALAEGVVASGVCGELATWTVTGTDTDLTLTISGSGDMTDYETDGAPWDDYSVYMMGHITTVVVEDGITSVGSHAFDSMIFLTSVSLGKDVSSIGEYAFESSRSLQYITFPDSLRIIGKYAFFECFNLQRISLPDGVERIGSSAFEQCRSLQNITLPDSVTSIGSSAFEKCSSLQSIAIPDRVICIEKATFYKCSSLQNITIPDSVTSIGEWAFADCKGLQSITLPDSVTSIGRVAFNFCTGLQSITIPYGVTSIEYRAFGSCTGLQSITIPYGVTSIDNDAFIDCESLQNITIPDSVTRIKQGAFSGCKGLQSIAIPDHVKIIEKEAFSGCFGLQKISFPKHLWSIGADAFNHCETLKDIYFDGTKAEWDAILGSSFYLDMENVVLHTTDGGSGAEKITLNKTSATLLKKESMQLKATVTPADASDGKVTWKTSNSKILTVSSTGLVKAVATGTATVTAYTGGNKLKATCSIKVVNPYIIKFDKNAKVAELSTKPWEIKPGNALNKTLPTPEYSGYYFLGWYTAKTGGTKVTAKTKPSKSMTLFAHWVKVQSLAKATVTVASCTYNTKAQKPKVTVKLGSKTLKEGTDYTLTYANNKIASRKAVVTVKGKNAYKASVKKLFTISQRDISKSPVSIKLKKTKFGYTGKAIKPGYTAAITVDGKAVNLVNGTDFKVAYKNNVRIGTASIVFTGKGNYKGTKTLKFYILKKATVTLDLNKGTGSRVTPVLPKGSQNTVEILAGEKIGKIPTPTRKGYTFVGWYTTPKATGGNLIVSGRTIFAASETKNQKIYARWKRNTYKITFKYDNYGLLGPVCPFTLPQEMTYNVEKAVTLPILTSEYAKFNGWKHEPTAVTTDKLIKKIGEKPTSGDLVLYLDYTNYEYSIEFSGSDGGSVSNGVKQCLTWFSKDTLPKVSCTPPAGKKFDKWYCTENGQYYPDGAEFDRLTTENGKVFHFVAVWKDALGESVVEYAKTWLGKIPYGSSSGTYCDVSSLTRTDCSGFVCGVYYHFNINLWNFKGEIRNSPLVTSIGTTDYNQAKPGDIIWWESNNPDKTNGHVAIYAGGGYMVDETTDSYGGVSGNVLFRPVSEVANNRPIKGIFRVKE